jgi:hypothetical protein
MRIRELIEELSQIEKDYGNLVIIPYNLDITVENDLIDIGGAK